MSHIYEALTLIDDPTARSISQTTPPRSAHTAIVVAMPEPKPVTMPEVERHGAERVRTLPLRLAADRPLLPFDGVHQQAAEQYRMVRTTIAHHPLKPRLVVVSSAGPGDGKTVTAINIAGAIAMASDSTVLLVDGDMRRSSAADALGIPPTPGLGEVLRGECSIDDAIVRLEQLPNLHVLPAGSLPGSPTELLDSEAWRSLTAALRVRYHFVILDSTPVIGVVDFALLQMSADAVLLVVRPDHTSRPLWRKTLETVAKEKLLGVVLNAIEPWPLSSSQESVYYYGRQAAPAAGQKLDNKS